MTVTLKNKPPIGELDTALRRAGFKRGENLEFKVLRKKVTIVLREDDDGSTPAAPAERRSVARMLATSEKDYKAGRTYGPFNTAGEMAASIEENIRKLRVGKRKAKSAR